MAITATEMIECVKTMTVEEKAALISALGIIPVAMSGSLPGRKISGAQAYQEIMAGMSREQRDEMQRLLLCSELGPVVW